MDEKGLLEVGPSWEIARGQDDRKFDGVFGEECERLFEWGALMGVVGDQVVWGVALDLLPGFFAGGGLDSGEVGE